MKNSRTTQVLFKNGADKFGTVLGSSQQQAAFYFPTPTNYNIVDGMVWCRQSDMVQDRCETVWILLTSSQGEFPVGMGVKLQEELSVLPMAS